MFCKHYTGTAYGKECRAGVPYDTFAGQPPEKFPCVAQARRETPHDGSLCSKCEMPTEEELDAEDREIKVMFENSMKARAAIVDHIGGPWRRGDKSVSGAINCPVCSGKDSLRFSRAGYNGHVHASCTTAGCVQWME